MLLIRYNEGDTYSRDLFFTAKDENRVVEVIFKKVLSALPLVISFSESEYVGQRFVELLRTHKKLKFQEVKKLSARSKIKTIVTVHAVGKWAGRAGIYPTQASVQMTYTVSIRDC